MLNSIEHNKSLLLCTIDTLVSAAYLLCSKVSEKIQEQRGSVFPCMSALSSCLEIMLGNTEILKRALFLGRRLCQNSRTNAVFSFAISLYI